MATDTLYSQEKLEECRQALTELAQQPQTQFSKREVVAALYDELVEVLQRHTYEQAAKLLHGKGIEISAGSLKQYVGRCRREREEQQTGPKRKSKSQKKVSPQKRESDVTLAQQPQLQTADEVPLAY